MIAVLALPHITTTVDCRGVHISTKRVSTSAVYEQDSQAFEADTCIYCAILSLQTRPQDIDIFVAEYIHHLFFVSPFVWLQSAPRMTIPVYRHNQDHDDWEVASAYDSDDCGSLGGSGYDESMHSSGHRDDPALRLEAYHSDSACPRFVNGYPVPQRQRRNYSPATFTRPGWDTRHVPGKQSSFVVPPPGVISSKDWVHPPQDMHWPSMTPQMTSSSELPCTGLMEPPSPPSLLLSPSPLPRAPSPLTKRPLPATTVAYGPPSHTTPVTMSGTSTGANVDVHASPIMPPPPRYHEVAHAIPPRLVDAGCQVHSSTAMSPPRRSGHDILSSYGPGPGPASMPWYPRSRDEFAGIEGRYGGHSKHGPGDGPDARPPPVPSKHERGHEHEQDGGRTRVARLQVRQRRPSMWQRLVRRFSPSHVSVGQLS